MRAIDTDGLDEEIRCEMCRNQIKTDRGCDGHCKYDEKLYEKIIQILDKRIKPLPSAQPETHEERTKTHACDLIERRAAIDAIESTDWYRIEGGELVHGANSREDEPLYKAKDIHSVIENLPFAQSELCEDAEFWRKRAENYSSMCMDLIAEMGKGIKIESVKISGNGIEFIKEQPSAHPDSCDKLKRCKFEYINACKILAHRTSDTRKKDIDDAYAVVKALHPIFGEEEF